jgi:hypothetical protein
MVVIDILKEKLVGKEVLVYEFYFKISDKRPIERRYCLNKNMGLGFSKADKRMTYIGEVYKTVIDIIGSSDPYEGDVIYIYIDAEPMNEILGVTILDEIIIKE